MLQHIPWKGHRYEEGINSQRICIVGNSHWVDEGEKDSIDSTIVVITKVIEGFWNIAFFTKIRNYFGFTCHREFWDRVIFVNYLPECIGGPNERYNTGTKEQIECAKQRFLTLIRKEHPHKVFVFSKQAWSTFPTTREEEACGRAGPVLSPNEFPEFSWGTYDAGGHLVLALGLRHPQWADGQLMQRAVRYALNKPAPDVCLDILKPA